MRKKANLRSVRRRVIGQCHSYGSETLNISDVEGSEDENCDFYEVYREIQNKVSSECLTWSSVIVSVVVTVSACVHDIIIDL
ncbi:hypothetical protein Y032_0289g1503 [Ancylostoma ceylanicum]|uniref:Uncharacterized protein n=1 Tax=Ancylostoma ceylanicum TaxID=53326 RepID=A0A016S5C1_9BILA|nr:hypothetical protein Y032_0289g1503 [Ancylostoma ceylanicum]